MNKPEEMNGTNIIVFKNSNNKKFIILREYIGSNLFNIVKTNFSIDNELTDIGRECGYIIVADEFFLEDKNLDVNCTIYENYEIKETFVNVDSKLLKTCDVIIPHKEEPINSISGTFHFNDVIEITGDLDMIQTYLKEGVFYALDEELISYGIEVKPRFTVLGNTKDKIISKKLVKKD